MRNTTITSIYDGILCRLNKLVLIIDKINYIKIGYYILLIFRAIDRKSTQFYSQIEESFLLKEENEETTLFISYINTDEDIDTQENNIVKITDTNLIYKIGKSDECSLSLKGPNLSKVHCTLKFIKKLNKWALFDGDNNENYSKNGTWVYLDVNLNWKIEDGLIFSSNWSLINLFNCSIK